MERIKILKWGQARGRGGGSSFFQKVGRIAKPLLRSLIGQRYPLVTSQIKDMGKKALADGARILTASALSKVKEKMEDVKKNLVNNKKGGAGRRKRRRKKGKESSCEKRGGRSKRGGKGKGGKGVRGGRTGRAKGGRGGRGGGRGSRRGRGGRGRGGKRGGGSIKKKAGGRSRQKRKK